MKTPLEVLEDLVRIESPSGREERAADYLRALVPGAIVSGRNVWAVRGEGSPTLLLNSHTDTVPATPAWTKPPFDALNEDGKLYGLGVSDAKACVVGQLFAFLNARVPKGTLVWSATCDEETGGQGLEVLARDLPRPDASVIGEPTDMQPCIGQRGLLKLEVVAKGRAGHASRPHQGDNAIYRAARAALAIEALNEKIDPDDSLLGKATLCATLIAGGTRSNVIPPECRFTVDGRSTPNVDNEALIRMVRQVLSRDPQVEVTAKSGRFHPVLTPESARIVQVALAASAGSRARAFGGVSDLFHVRDCPGIIIGPGVPDQSHQADEHIAIEKFERGVEVYRWLVEGYFS